jgi:diguanylate cyclase (GGDEF)-like protein
MVSRREAWFAEIPHGLEAWVDNRLLSAHLRILNALILGHLLNAAMLVAVFHGDVSAALLYGWGSLVAALCVHRYAIGAGERRKAGKRDATRLIRALELNTVALALTVAVALGWLMPLAGVYEQVFLAIVGTTLIAAAGYTMRTLPRAALAYIGAISFGLIFGLLRTGSLEALAGCVLLGASGLLLGRMALTAHSLFVIRILRERELSATTETVKMLLNDYQDHGSDWLFEIDGDGRLLGASARFSIAAEIACEDLNGRPLADLFVDGPEKAQLIDHFTSRRAFRALALPLGTDGNDRRWWSVSGRPAEGGATSSVRFRGVITDISAEKQAEARVRHMAHYDSLTGLPNRLMFTTALNRMIGERPDGARRALMLIDVDHFKNVNDMYGHPTGDAFLRQIATRIVDCAHASQLGGEGHLVARLGGDEFAILMAGEDVVDHATRFAEALVLACKEPLIVNGHELHPSVSVGLALAPDHGDTAAILQSNADIALYCAKGEGRNRWEMFEPGMDVAIQQRHALERDLRQALVRDELRLFLQPLVDVETSAHVGFEALVRWEQTERGMIMPNDFIPLAEETGLIVPIGEWVIRSAIAEAARWDQPLAIAINLSPIQLRSPNLLPVVMTALAETGLDPSRVEMEITETVLMNECEANIAVLNRLHDLGIKIALDDFGTGYASLNYLLTFPFDKIKIDRTFVSDIESREESRAIVGAVIGLANKLGMCTLAEGVEHEAQLAQLREEGCAMVQGWLFGKALPAEHYRDLRKAELDLRRAA